MSTTIITAFFFLLALCIGVPLGMFLGASRQRDLWRRHMEVGHAYRRAVEALDWWCGHCSPHAKLIADHLAAAGEGHSRNAGTPHGSEPCTIDGLREQLRRLDASRAAP